ncbi:hypothetical protein [Candidatus Tokpelaia sp.]|uniref:hypothetical protein n=1 Tax=Candidatus Tokpelaia sp. TaxID=2233777 RepID=UPI0012395728|nr:hypothetical protein [Candidatus Tokpelaia sp.]KAA6405502.1 hypothetical protein DPQ22_04115 [Candidatus Tokpelaia sp.]
MSTYASCSIENGQIILNAGLYYAHEDWSKLKEEDKKKIKKFLPLPARLLLDTGASCSCICKSQLQPFKDLGLLPRETISILTPSTGTNSAQRDSYEMGLLVGGHINIEPHIEVSVLLVETDFTGQNIDGLLGMDILEHCHMSFSGINKTCFLSFHDVIPPMKANKVPPLGVEGDALKGL